MKNKKQIVFFLLLVGGLAVSITGCKTKKEISREREIREAKELFTVVVDNTLEYKTFSGKMKTSLRMGKTNVDITAYLKILKDEKLMLSFQMPLLGELFKFGISQDSLIIIDRMNKQFVSESMQNIKQLSGFDFNVYNLQSLFTNQLFLSGKSRITEKDYSLFSIEQSQEQAIIKTKEKYGQINYSFIVDYTDHIKTSSLTGNNGKIAMNWDYSNFSSLENKRLFPMQQNMNLAGNGNKFSMNFSISKIDFDKVLDIDFNIPKKYSQITLEQAMKLIKSLQQ